MPKSLPDQVYDALVTEARAPEISRADFIRSWDDITEFRFMGGLGFGGRFWRNPKGGVRGYPERWYVTAYRVDETPEVRERIERTNRRLEVLNPYHVRTTTPKGEESR